MSNPQALLSTPAGSLLDSPTIPMLSSSQVLSVWNLTFRERAWIWIRAGIDNAEPVKNEMAAPFLAEMAVSARRTNAINVNGFNPALPRG